MRPRSTRSPSAAEYHLSRAQYTQAAVGRRASEVGRRVGACGVRFVYNPLFTRPKSPVGLARCVVKHRRHLSTLISPLQDSQRCCARNEFVPWRFLLRIF
jgi:hypothetical protein